MDYDAHFISYSDRRPRDLMAESPARLKRRPAPAVAPKDCSIVRALSVVGERWTLLVLRQVFYGVTRFDDMQVQLAVARKTLSERLAGMVKNGLLVRVPYLDASGRQRLEYRMTPKGDDLATTLVSLMQWADRHLPSPKGRPLKIVDPETAQEIRAALIREDGKSVERLDAASRHPWPDRT